MPEKLLLTVSEAALMLGVGKTYAYRLVASGELPSCKLGKSRRIALTEVHRYVERLVQDAKDGVA